jgi:hypothetical protein
MYGGVSFISLIRSPHPRPCDLFPRFPSDHVMAYSMGLLDNEMNTRA